MEKSFMEYIKERCPDIVDKVLKGMKCGKVSETNITTENPILYRWLFPYNPESKSELFKTIEAYHNDPAANPKHEDILDGLMPVEKDGIIYYALYFGKSNNGSHRYRQHKAGNVHLSTLRHTIYGLCFWNEPYDKEKEGKVSEILNQCYYEWFEFEDERNLVDCIEGICIATGNYPLNMEGNPNISEEWRKYVMAKRKLK